MRKDNAYLESLAFICFKVIDMFANTLSAAHDINVEITTPQVIPNPVGLKTVLPWSPYFGTKQTVKSITTAAIIPITSVIVAIVISVFSALLLSIS